MNQIATETKPVYQTSTMGTLSALNLVQLQTVRHDWVFENLDFVKDIALAVRSLGQPVQVSHREYYRLQVDDLYCYYNRTSDGYISSLQLDKIKYSVIVFLGADGVMDSAHLGAPRLVNVAWVNIGENANEKNNIFVPGRWMEKFDSVIPGAKAREHEFMERKEEKERQDLLKKLLVGKNI